MLGDHVCVFVFLVASFSLSLLSLFLSLFSALVIFSFILSFYISFFIFISSLIIIVIFIITIFTFFFFHHHHHHHYHRFSLFLSIFFKVYAFWRLVINFHAVIMDFSSTRSFNLASNGPTNLQKKKSSLRNDFLNF